ncbi:unnamed protein product [Closterium sp. NIES-64]|nr:unnamed protein product [Closterium sp. NIES-64]
MDQSKRGPRAGDAEVVDTASIPAGIASGAAERNSEKGGMAERDAEGGERAEKAERAAEKGAEAAGGGIGAADELRARVGRRMAKKIKKVVAAGKGDAKHYYDVYGAQARAELELRPPVSKGAEQRAKPLSFTDVQDLILWVLTGEVNPQWVFIKNKPLVSRVVVLLVPGIDAHTFHSHPDLFPNLHRCFGGKSLPLKAVSPAATVSDTMKAMFARPVALKSKPPLPPEHYLLTWRQLKENNFPLPVVAGNKGRDGQDGKEAARKAGGSISLADGSAVPPPGQIAIFPGYVMTRPWGGGKKRGKQAAGAGKEQRREYHRLVAVDCEMCNTRKGLELTRLTLLDAHGKVLLDELVKPDSPITNYNTQFSGITPQMLAGVTTTLQQAQEHFLGIVSAETILVGHSTESDLHAIRAVHLRVIDTLAGGGDRVGKGEQGGEGEGG